MRGFRLPAATVAFGLTLWACSPASAEYKTTTAQALAAQAEWLPYAPPPEHGAAAVCLVDTGVDLNPDTSSNVVAHLALDGGDPGDLSESKHGTQMAMVMGAPINGWGMVGIWPGVRIVSVRAAVTADGTFSFAAYRNGIEACLESAGEHGIRTVVLPLDGDPPATDDERRELSDTLDRAAKRGISVFAAAGNSGGSPSVLAAEPHVVAVGAATPDGELCPFSSRGTGVRLYVVGCGLDQATPTSGDPVANGGGTSQSSAIAGALGAALRSYRPDLDAHAVEELLDASQDGDLSLAKAFVNAGLGSTVEAATRAYSAAKTRSPITKRRVAKLPDPRVRVRHRHRNWRITLLNRPQGATVLLRHRKRGVTLYRRPRRMILVKRNPSSMCIEYRQRGRPGSKCVPLIA